MFKIRKSDVPFLGLLIFICGSFSSSGYVQIASLIIFISLSINKIHFTGLDSQSKYQMLFSLFVAISFLWAAKVPQLFTLNIGMIVSMFGILYTAIFLNSYLKEVKDYKRILNIILISLVYLVLQLFLKVPLSHIIDYSYWDDFGMNKNATGMNLAWGCLICFYIIYNKLSNKLRYKILLVIFFAFVVIASSRKALLILVISIPLYLLLCEKNSKLVRNIFFITLMGGISLYSLFEVPYFYQLIGMKIEDLLLALFKIGGNATEDGSILERTFFKTYAINMFNENMLTRIFGNGLNSFQSEMFRINYSNVAYSHCNYTELLCNYGIIGFFLYYYYKCRVVLQIFNTKRKNKTTVFFLIVLLISIVFEYGFVSYFTIFNQLLLLFVTKGIINHKIFD